MTRSTFTHNENLRQIEHMAPIAFAFLLRYLNWTQALIFASLAIIYALYLSPRLLTTTQRPDEERRGFSGGKVAYAVSVFSLILLFPREKYLVAAVWANLSVGDAASNLIGRHFGRRPLPWHPQKTWLGMGSAIAFSSIASTILILWTGLPSDLYHPLSRAMWYGSATSVVCSIAETLPLPVDDNITICIAGSAFLYWLTRAAFPERPRLATIAIGILVSGIAGITACFLRTITLGGMVLAVLLGTLVISAFGWYGFLLLLTFFVLGTAFSKVGYEEKLKRGSAQPERGKRGASHVWGKGFAAATAAFCCIFLENKEFITLGFVAAVAASLFDTAATELGQLFGRNPILLTSLQYVNPGTRGAVSLAGSGIGALSAGLICLEAYLAGMITGWGALWVLIAAWLAVHLESYLSARVSNPAVRCSGQLLNAFHTTIALLIAMLLARIRL